MSDAEFNPYAPPRADDGTPPRPQPPRPGTGSGAGLFRDGAELVVTRDADPLDRCVLCNAPAQGERYTTVLLGAGWTLSVGLCPDDRRRIQRRGNWAAYLFFGGLVTVMASLACLLGQSGPFLVAGVGLTLAGLILMNSGRRVRVARFDRHSARVAPVDPEFLAALPELPSGEVSL